MATEKTLQEILMNVVRILRGFKLNTEVVDAVSAEFGTSFPTMRLGTQRVGAPMARREHVFFHSNVPYDPDRDYIVLWGDDGVDNGVKVWLADLPKGPSTPQNVALRKAAKRVGIRKLPTEGKVLGANYRPFGNLLMGNPIAHKTMQQTPGIYWQANVDAEGEFCRIQLVRVD